MVKIRKNLKLYFLLVISLIIVLGFYFSIPKQLFKVDYSFVLFDRDGHLMGAHIADDGQWRFPKTDSVPEKFAKALMMFEDEHFYWHPGVNPLSLSRALWQNIKAGKVISGGSTITMQVIRLSRPCKRNAWNKMIEMVKALRLETIYSKDEILNLYASHAPFGGNVVGIEAASWRYFGRAPSDLTWSEAAMLAVLPNAPGLIHPGRNRIHLKRKRDNLLFKLYGKGIIDSLEYIISLEEPIPEQPEPLPSLAPHCLDYFQKKGISRVHSTIQYKLQEMAGKIVEQHSVQHRQNQIYNAAALIIDNNTGEVLTYIGNTSVCNNEDHGNNVDVIQASRSTGSILKPFLYASCLQDGLILPKSLLPDIPSYYHNFSPQNYNRTYDGAVRADEALARSLNVPAVRLLDDFGVDRFLTQLNKFGFTTFKFSAEHYGLALILGGGEVNLWELAGAYSSMARTLTRYITMNSVYSLSDWKEPVMMLNESINKAPIIYNEEPDILNSSSIYYTFAAMENVARPEEETGWELYQDSRRIAWKTGTSFGHRDAWAVGVTPEFTVATWVGNASGEGRPGLIGGSTASPVMFELFRLLPKTTWFDMPYDDMVKSTICSKSGLLVSEYCEDVDTMFVPNVSYKDLMCNYHKVVHLDEKGQFRVNSECYDPSGMKHVNWFVLPPIMGWYYKYKHPFYKTLPPFKKGCVANDANPMEMIYPPDNASILLPKNFQGETEKLVFKISHTKNSAHLFWHLDDKYIGETVKFHEKEMLFSPGWHKITVIDEEGNELVRRINCLNKD